MRSLMIFLAGWFIASEIDFNHDNMPDLVVKPEEACLFGANIGPFWVFRKTVRGYEKVWSVDTLNSRSWRPKLKVTAISRPWRHPQQKALQRCTYSTVENAACGSPNDLALMTSASCNEVRTSSGIQDS
jgi:hypothetical protein